MIISISKKQCFVLLPVSFLFEEDLATTLRLASSEEKKISPRGYSKGLTDDAPVSVARKLVKRKLK